MSKCIICNDEVPEGKQICDACIDAPLYKNPCKPDCEYRTITCHSECERYKIWSELRTLRNSIQYAQKQQFKW